MVADMIKELATNIRYGYASEPSGSMLLRIAGDNEDLFSLVEKAEGGIDIKFAIAVNHKSGEVQNIRNLLINLLQ
jgi:hypothetical protein